MNIATLWFAADVVIKATAILLAAWALCTIMSSAPSSRRHLVLFLALAGVLVMPVLCAVLPEWRLLPNWAGTAPQSFHQSVVNADHGRAPTEFASTAVNSASVQPTEFTGAEVMVAGRPSKASPAISRSASTQFVPVLRLENALLALWVFGLGILLLRIVLARISLWRLAARSTAITDGAIAALFADASCDLQVRRRLSLLISDDRAMPMTWASLRPKILLPANARNWSHDRLRMSMLHELAHVKRWDAATQFVGQLACAVFWFHPLAWLASRGMLREQEQAADDLVLGRCNCPTDYASFLLDVARMIGSQRLMMRGAIAMARPKTLASRLEAVLDISRARQGVGPKHLVIGLAIAFMVLPPLASLHAQSKTAPTAKSPTTLPSTATTAFYGHILSPDGKPVGNADIVLIFGWGNTVARTRSATDGSFAISGPFIPTRYRVAVASVRADGMGFGSGMLSSGKDNIIRIKPSSSVRVTFLDPGGKPVAGMRVWPTSSTFGRFVLREISSDSDPGSIEYPAEWAKDHALKTDADGACVIPMLPRQATTALEIDRDEYAQPTTDQRIRTGAAAQSLPVTIHLQAGGSIAGRVMDSKTGKGVAGIHLMAISRKPQHSLGLAVSGEDGEYRISQLLPEKYVIHLNEREGFPRTAAFRGNVEVFAGQTTGGQDMTLVDGTVVTGRLIEPDTGRGVASALIYAIDLKTHEYPGNCETDAGGRFELRVPPGDEGIYMGSPAPEGYSSEGFNSVDYHVKEFRAIDGQKLTIDLKLALKPGKPVSGRVLDPKGHPASDVYVQCLEENGFSPFDHTGVKTDANGNFRFRAVAPGSELSVLSGDMGTGEPISVEGGEQNLVLHLLPHVRTALIGRVVDKQGNPFPNVGVYLSRFGRQYGFGPSNVPDALTDPQGRFRIPGLISGWQYKLTVASHGHDPSRTIDIHYKPGDTICDLGDIVEKY